MTPDSFIRKMCHDVRAPIRALRELPVWLADDLAAHMSSIPEPVQETLTMMQTQASRLDRVIEDLHAYAKLQRSDAASTTDLRALVRAAPWSRSIDCDLAALEIGIEAAHAEMLVNNLIDNAFKHAEAHEKRATLLSRIEGDRIRLAVSDRGPGIAPEHRSVVYDPLSTLKPRDECEGSGMGLAIVARIASMYGGDCSIKPNASGPGICSSVRLPLR